MTKSRAFTIHLATSILIFMVFLGIMFFVWYPAPYFEIDGGWKVLRILAGVDVVLGPLLTLIVFKPGKPSLKFDMSCIVLLQLGALLYWAAAKVLIGSSAYAGLAGSSIDSTTG